MEGYMTLKEAAEKWGIGDRRINTLSITSRSKGNMWCSALGFTYGGRR